MPAFNEEALPEFLAEIEKSLAPAVASLEFVVVDDASAVPVEVLLAEHRFEVPVHVHRNTSNRGHGHSAVMAYRHGLACGVDVIVHVDGDGQFEGSDLVRLIQHLGDHDGVIGVRGGRREAWYRRLITATACRMVGVKPGAWDPNTPLRAYRTRVIALLLEDLPTESVVPHLLFTIAERRSGLSMAGLVVSHRPRRGDTATGTSWRRAPWAPYLPSVRLIRLAAAGTAEVLRARRSRPAPELEEHEHLTALSIS